MNYCVAGVDEAGRGALAGPVVAAAVILSDSMSVDCLKDSKKLTLSQRESAFEFIFANTPYISIALHSPRFIDQKNILQATLSAMKYAILRLPIKPDKVQIDGNKAPKMPQYNLETIVKGDALVPAISAASIVAKVTRDRIMQAIHTKFPAYEFDQNKGYGTQAHYEHIFSFGVSPVHRRSFNLTQQGFLFHEFAS